jgi:hypothetical protein
MNIIITYIHINSNFILHVKRETKNHILKINEILLTINYPTAYTKLQQQQKNGGYDHFPFVDVETAK